MRRPAQAADHEQVKLCGWVDRRRDHGGVIFIDLRDRSSTVQITVDPDLGADAFAVAEHLRSETVLQVSGKVRARPAESLNDRLATGEVEVLANAITVLNGVKGNLPFPVSIHDEESTAKNCACATLSGSAPQAHERQPAPAGPDDPDAATFRTEGFIEVENGAHPLHPGRRPRLHPSQPRVRWWVVCSAPAQLFGNC